VSLTNDSSVCSTWQKMTTRVGVSKAGGEIDREHRSMSACSQFDCALTRRDPQHGRAGGDSSCTCRCASCSHLGRHLAARAPAQEQGSKRRRPAKAGFIFWGSWVRWLLKSSNSCLHSSNTANPQETSIRRLTEDSSHPLSQEHISESTVRSQMRTHTAADDIQVQQYTSRLQSHPRRTYSDSSSGRGPYVFLLAMLFLAALLPAAKAGIVQGSVKLIPSGVLQMKAEWTDLPKTGAT